jgi:hypothetical protein
VAALATNGDTVYVGGFFNTAGGASRGGVAAIDATTGLATAWDPGPAGRVTQFILNGETIYVRGDFSTIGGASRNGLAELDATTGLATPWNPNPSLSAIAAIALSGNTLYVAGDFATIGGASRNGLAAIDIVTGLATSWNPAPDGYISALAVEGGTVYVGGWDFTTIGGASRNNLAALDAATGLATAWSPSVELAPWRILTSGDTLFVGGLFRTVNGERRTHLLHFPGSLAAAVSAAATNVGSAGATLNGSVDANGYTTAVHFELSNISGEYGSAQLIDAAPAGVTGNQATAVSATVHGLLPNTTYYFRVRAASAPGIAYSAERSFTTAPQQPPLAGDPPVIVTQPAGAVVLPGAQITLSVAASGAGALTYQWYEGDVGDTGTPLGGADGASLTIAAPAATTRYWVRVSGSGGARDSQAAMVIVLGQRIFVPHLGG